MQYRLAYDRDHKSKSGTKRFSLFPAPEVLEFLVMAALAGVLGGASYDAVKIALVRIRSQSAQMRPGKDEAAFGDDELIMEYARAIATDLRSIPDPVRLAVLEEVVVDGAQPRIQELIESAQSGGPSQLSSTDMSPGSPLQAAMQKVLKETADDLPTTMLPPSDVDWDNLFRNAGKLS